MGGECDEREASYDPDTGLITGPSGKIWSAKSRLGYICGHYNGKHVKAHRLAWYLTTGYWPEHEVDHINGDRADNRWCNLREATRSENNWNVGLLPNNTSGLKGVSWHKPSRKWRVRVQHFGIVVVNTLTEDIELAQLISEEARNKYHGIFARNV